MRAVLPRSVFAATNSVFVFRASRLPAWGTVIEAPWRNSPRPPDHHPRVRMAIPPRRLNRTAPYPRREVYHTSFPVSTEIRKDFRIA